MNFLPAHSGIKLDLEEDGKCNTPFCKALKSTYIFSDIQGQLKIRLVLDQNNKINFEFNGNYTLEY